MIKIIFLCNWGNSSKELLEQYKKSTKNLKGEWGIIKGVSNLEDADYYIVLEDLPNSIHIKSLDSEKIICFPREPPDIRRKKQYTSFNLKHGYTYETIYHVVPQFNFLGKTFDQLVELPYTSSIKKHNISCVVSGKRHTKGARKRLDVISQLSNKIPDLHLYGRDIGHLFNKSSCYKGSVKFKYEALAPYNYSFCFENSSIKNYFSEKFTDSILSWTVPIYWGCPNIDEYFPKGSYYYVDINSLNIVEQILEIVNNPITQENIDALKEARRRILFVYNIWPTISKIISKKSFN